MKIEIHHFIHWGDTVHEILSEIHKMNAKLDDLEAKVQRDTDVTSSAVTLLQTLSQQIKEAGLDPIKLAEITTKLDTNTDALAAAVAANTVADPVNG